ncbi:MAG TPA: PAS domain S-box protein [Gemmatimonadaceae bacterium]|nr:PAS domain S-box protein [Gemmatimonadaceae bacterium]
MDRRRILIVDDELPRARALEGMLAELGHEVAAIASSGAEAIALVDEATPQLVLLDVALSGDVDAVKTVEEIRRRRPVAVLFTAAADEGAALARVGGTESHEVLTVPCTARELRLTVELALCRHEAARQLPDLEERFFAVSIDLVCCLDFNGYFKRLNPAWERTLGLTRQELMSRPFIEFVHPDDRERTLNQNREVRGGGQALGFENRYLCKDGSYRWLLWNAAPDADGRVIFAVARDITARKQAEEDRERLVRELRAALDEVRTLREILPICSYCKKIRDDENYWQSVEGYISSHTNTRFSHGICPACYAREIEPQLGERE